MVVDTAARDGKGKMVGLLKEDFKLGNAGEGRRKLKVEVFKGAGGRRDGYGMSSVIVGTGLGDRSIHHVG